MNDVILTKEQYDELMKLQKGLIEKVEKLEGGRADAIGRDEHQKMLDEAMLKLKQAMEPKVIFGGEAKAGEVKASFQRILRGIKDKDPLIVKTVMSEGTPAQGGYTVPQEYSDMILGALNNEAEILQFFSSITQGAPTINYPSWLNDLGIYWVAEDATKTLTKPTLGTKALTLKKMACVVPFTDELLDDNIVDLSGECTKLVGENMGLEVERVALEGNTGEGDPFAGVLTATGTVLQPQVGGSIAYSDLVAAMFNTSVLRRFKKNAIWMLNETALGKIFSMVDGNGLPIMSLGNPNAQIPSTILGKQYKVSDQIAAAATTTIYFGDPKYIVIGNPKKNAGVQVAVSQSAVAPITGALTQNAFLQDETWYRFVHRKAILVAVPSAFVAITNVA